MSHDTTFCGADEYLLGLPIQHHENPQAAINDAIERQWLAQMEREDAERELSDAAMVRPAPSPRVFICPVHVIHSSEGAVLRIISPKTGKVLSVPAAAAPVRLRGRIIQAASAGRHAVGFNRRELLDVLALKAAVVSAILDVPNHRPAA